MFRNVGNSARGKRNGPKLEKGRSFEIGSESGRYLDELWTVHVVQAGSFFVKLQKLTKDLQFDSTEEIGEFADRVSQINQKILDSTEAGLRFAEVIKFLPETSKRYLLQISELNEASFQISVLLLVAQSELVFSKLENINLKTL